jgi:hypothetical protein
MGIVSDAAIFQGPYMLANDWLVETCRPPYSSFPVAKLN